MAEIIGILGGSGFIGTNLVRHLRQLNYQVVFLPRIQHQFAIEAHTGRLSSEKNAQIQLTQAIDSAKVSTVINLAWAGLPDYGPETTGWNANLNTIIHQSWSQSNAETFVGFGSCLEYGKARGGIGETNPGNAVNFFGKTKSWLLDHVSTLAVEAGKTHLWVRPFWLYGPGQRESSLVPSTIKSAKKGEALSLRTPNVFVDFLHIDDLSSAVSELLVSKGLAGVVNVGSGRAIRVGDVAKMVLSIVRGTAPHPLTPPDFQSDASWSTNARLRELTNWREIRHFEDRLESLVREEQGR